VWSPGVVEVRENPDAMRNREDSLGRGIEKAHIAGSESVGKEILRVPLMRMLWQVEPLLSRFKLRERSNRLEDEKGLWFDR
jgi:hypothetical protein